MNWIWWLSIGFALGVYFGVALTSLLRLSSRQQSTKRQSADIRWLALSANPLEGPSTTF